jgi:hypothetical protein
MVLGAVFRALNSGGWLQMADVIAGIGLSKSARYAFRPMQRSNERNVANNRSMATAE